MLTAANPDYRGPVYLRNGKVSRQVTDIDLLVTETAGPKPEKILEMKQIKSGASDTPGEAKKQHDNAQKALAPLPRWRPENPY